MTNKMTNKITNKKSENMYHYVDSGLDFVYLQNGFEVIEDKYLGKMVAIHNLDGLNKLIGNYIVEHCPCLRGQELRFLRSELKMSQTNMADLVGSDIRTIQRWEKDRNNQIDAAADKLIRLTYKSLFDKRHVAAQAIKQYNAARAGVNCRKIKPPRLRAIESHDSWKSLAA